MYVHYKLWHVEMVQSRQQILTSSNGIIFQSQNVALCAYPQNKQHFKVKVVSETNEPLLGKSLYVIKPQAHL